jgi:hypothetical protein
MVSKPELARYLRTFAIAYVILDRPRADLLHAPELLQELPRVGGRRVFQARWNLGPVLQGGGTLRARTNRIELRGTSPERDVVDPRACAAPARLRDREPLRVTSISEWFPWVSTKLIDL